MTRRAQAIVGVTCSLVTLLALLGVQAVGAADSAATSDAQIAREELALAAKALETISHLESSGQVSPGMREVPRWSRRLVEATRKSGATKQQQIAALKQHFGRMTARVEVLRRLHKAGAATTLNIMDAEYDVLEARAWLQEQGVE